MLYGQTRVQLTFRCEQLERRRLLANAYYYPGELDPGLSGTSFNGLAADLVRQPDDKYVAAVVGRGKFSVGRFLHNGTPDASFGAGGFVDIDMTSNGTNQYATDVALLPGGTILATGSAETQFSGGPYRLIMSRYTITGARDTSFGGGSGRVISNLDGFTNTVGLGVGSDGSMLIGDVGLGLAKFHADGSVDTSYGTNGVVHPSVPAGSDARDMKALADGSVVICGSTPVGSVGNRAIILARYTASGAPDPTFGTNGILQLTS